MHRFSLMALLALMVAPAIAPAALGATVQINIQNFNFGVNDAPVTIQVGDTVVWTNRDVVPHTATSGTPGNDTGIFDSGFLNNGGTFQFTFNEAGEFPYYCQVHPEMQSRIIVEQGSVIVRDLGGASDNAIAVARHGGTAVVAAAAGTRLYVLDALDDGLTPVANWTGGKDVGAAVTGRPAFGAIGAGLVVAVGTEAGRGFVFDVASGDALVDVGVASGAIANAPAIVQHGDATDIYWAADTTDGPALFRTRGTSVQPEADLGPDTAVVLSSPAIFGGTLIVGTSSNVQTFRVDPASGALTPQSTAAPGSDFNTSPVVCANGEALIGAAAGTVYKVNLSTGNEDGTVDLPAGVTSLSNPFISYATDTAAFGASDGNLYYVTCNAIGTNPSLENTRNFGTSAVSAPVIVASNTYAANEDGRFGAVGDPNPVSLAGEAGRAVVATGPDPANDRVLVNTLDGRVFAMPLASVPFLRH